MRTFRSPSKRLNVGILCAMAIASAALLLPSGVTSGAVIFSDGWPQGASYSTQNSNLASHDTNWTFTAGTGGNIATQNLTTLSGGNGPNSESTYYNLTMLQNAIGSAPTLTAITNSNAGLGSFQANTTYVLSFYVGSRSDSDKWVSPDTSTLTGEITDGLGDIESSTTATAPTSAGAWYEYSTTFTTGASPPAGTITLELIGNTLGNVQQQISIGDVSLSATPEPGSLCLLGIFGIGALARRRRAPLV